MLILILIQQKQNGVIMNNSDPNQILLQLKQLGLINSASDLTAMNNEAVIDGDYFVNIHNNRHNSSSHDDMPWFLHLFFAFSGLLASIFFVGFLTLALYQSDFLDSAIGLFIIGTCLIGVGLLLFKSQHTRRSTFWNSLAFAISIAGQLYVAFALMSSGLDEPLNIWLFLLIQTLITIIMPNFIYRLLSSVVALGCMVYLLNFYQLPEVSLGLLALVASITNLQRYAILQSVPVKWRKNISDIIRSVAYASALMLLCVSVYFIAAEYGGGFISDDQRFHYNYLLAQGLLILASLYAVYLIVKRYNVVFFSKPSLVIMGTIVILGIISVYVSGLLATSLIIIIAMANSQRVLLGLGIMALIGYIFWYYYQLDTSLLVKSGSMLIIGVALLLMRWLLVSRAFASSVSLATPRPETLSDQPTNRIDSQERPS